MPSLVGRPARPPTVTTSVGGSSAARTEANESDRSAPESARKHVTVLFDDISGFTALSEKLDPEAVTDLMNGCLSRLADVVRKYEGHVDKFIGDCIMALFGAPIAHENDPELAIRAALEMKLVTAEYNKILPVRLEKPLSLHIGVNSGMVVAGAVGSSEHLSYTVMGDTVNLASRLESLASDGQIFISKYTHNLVRNKFDFRAHDPIKVKGKTDPVPVFEVVGLKTDLTEDRQPVKTPLIGRSAEMGTLIERIDRLLAGDAQVVFLQSDAGVGKSRIQREIETYLRDKEVQILQSACHSFGRTVSYYVFAELLKRLLDMDSSDSPTAMADKLRAHLPLVAGVPTEPMTDELRDGLVFLGAMIGLDLGAEYDVSLDQVDAQDAMMFTFRAFRWLLERLAAHKPLILILEDLHFADALSIDLLRFLIDGMDSPARILLLVLMRPEKGHPSEHLPTQAERRLGSRCGRIVFDRLRPEESDQMVRTLLLDAETPENVLSMVRQRADGNPFFIEAIVRDLMDNQVIDLQPGQPVRVLKNLDEIAIPETIQGMVVSQIDRLPPELKETLQAAAVIGPVFHLELIKRITDDGVEDRLNHLAGMDLVFESKTFPEVEYSFKNILIQEAAYACLLHKRQREWHERIAEAMRSMYQERLEDWYERLAHHYEHAKRPEQAYEYAIKSALKAKRIFANQNAVDHFRLALTLSETLADPQPSLADVHIWMSEVYELIGDLDAAIDARRKAVALLTDPLQRADSERHIGRILEKQGKKEDAFAVYQQVYTLLENHPDSLEMARLLMNESWVLNRMRRNDEALQKCLQALELFERLASVEDIAQAHNNLAVFYEGQQELDRALEHNFKSMDLFRTLNNKRKLGNAFLSLGYVYDKRNECDTALGYFEEAIVTTEKIGNRYGAGTALMAKGRCYMDMGQLDEAESVLLRALRVHKELGLNLKTIANDLALARVCLGKENYALAHSYLQDARTIAEADDNRSELAKVIHAEAGLSGKEGQDPRAKFDEAIALFEALGRPRDADRARADLETYNSHHPPLSE